MSFLDLIKTAETTERAIYDIAQAFRDRRWVKILSVLGAIALLLNPQFIEIGLKPFAIAKPPWYFQIWLLVTLSLLISAFFIALRRKKTDATNEALPQSIIKGLLPYTNSVEDSAWFGRLQRGAILQDCLRFCAGEHAFGVLSGESGTGKTSLLQAGLLHELTRRGERPVYVKLTHCPPIVSIRQALTGKSDGPLADGSQALVQLLEKVTPVDLRPTIIILDQFEQFFVHHRNNASRRPFIRQMAEWHKRRDLPIKILISIRDDFADRLTEFHKAMGYALTIHNKLRLEKFEPEEAANVIKVIATEAKIEFDEEFLRDLTKHELAHREEGAVSPVNIQILTWMIEGQKDPAGRAFNRKAFQKLGGVDGLLERFLNKALAARETAPRREAAIKVMLALTDQNMRAGVLSLRQLKEKLNGIVSGPEIEEAVSWLSRSDMRLITSIQGESVTGYELAHERIIPSLRRLAFKEITGTEKAQQTLDRRVNEWVGNDRRRRYLLTFREWWSIRHYSRLIMEGSLREQKQEFIRLSVKRVRARAGYILITLLFALTAYGGYIWYEKRPETQAYHAQQKLIQLLNSNKDISGTAYVALLLPLLESGKEQALLDRFWQQLDELNVSERAHLLLILASAYEQLDQSHRSPAEVQQVRQKIDETWQLAEATVGSDRAHILLAEAYSRLPGTESNVLTELARVWPVVEKVHRPRTVPSPAVSVLSSLARSYGRLSQTDKANEGLIKVAEIAEKLSDASSSSLCAEVLPSVAASYSRLPVPEALNGLNRIWQMLQKRTKHDLLSVLPSLAEAYSNISNKNESIKGLAQVWQVLEPIPSDSLHEAATLEALAKSYIKVTETDEALVHLDKIQSHSQKLTESWAQSRVLSALAESYAALGDSDKVLTALNELLSLATKFSNPDDRRLLLRSLGRAYGALSKREAAMEGLRKIEVVANEMNAFDRVQVLLTVAESAYRLHKHHEAENVLSSVQQLTNHLESDSKSLVLVRIATLNAKLANWTKSMATVNDIGSEVYTMCGLSRILIVRKDLDGEKNTIDALDELFHQIVYDHQSKYRYFSELAKFKLN